MRNASAVAHAPIGLRTSSHRRPHLTLVPTPAAASPPPLSVRMAALLAGLVCGFAVAGVAAVLGGGRPTGELVAMMVLAVPLAATLVRARVVTVRARRARQVGRTAVSGTVAPLGAHAA